MNRPLTHDEAFELLPWFANGTLPETEQEGVDRHVRGCLPCRVALQEQQRLRMLLREQPTVPLSAEQGFERLIGQLDAPRRRHAARRRGWSAGFAAPWSVLGRHAVTAAALVGALAVASWLVTSSYDGPQDGAFGTLTNEGGDDLRIDVVFVDGVTEAELQVLIGELGGTIASGPTDLGRYTIRLDPLAANESGVEETLRQLRADPRVRFAGRAFIGEPAP